MRTAWAIAALAASLLLGACSEEKVAEMPPPFALTEEAMGRYCGMNVLEHAGPKGQIILDKIPEAIWFSSARDALAFTMLPEEPRNIAAIYVSDMSKAPSWDQPGAENWIDAKTAYFVIESQQRGGMGNEEAVPFSKESDADAFVAKHGGRVVGFNDVPQQYILGSGAPAQGDDEDPVSPEGEPHNMGAHHHG
ncbi:nitrous oxide reductase accessory protein NosL [Tianweitania populi]|uniref:NosL copper chaperone n=1 Tax=Tianweitania populi TaxID=1607949 RepID=A0A8J3GIG9_9HYPH|nr:nitrous oxide reductase accessory protein NosL [Tianweitania populi]GHD07586.1 NosL copper chaperone [Tianweitania populi]